MESPQYMPDFSFHSLLLSFAPHFLSKEFMHWKAHLYLWCLKVEALSSGALWKGIGLWGCSLQMD